MNWKEIHEKALAASRRFRQCESDLLEILQQVDAQRVFERFGLTSTFSYCKAILGLTEEQSFTFIRVARKAVEVPELKTAIATGAVTVTAAKKISSVLTTENQKEWIDKAAVLPQRELERQVAQVSPKTAIPQKLKPVAEDTTELRCAIDFKTEKALRRVQDILSQKLGKAVELGESIGHLCEFFLDKKDPVRTAQRTLAKKTEKGPATAPGTSPLPKDSMMLPFSPMLVARPLRTTAELLNRQKWPRTPLRAAVVQAVQIRDEWRCTFIDAQKRRCEASRWLHTHHRRPLSKGGSNDVSNLVTLCSAHHRMVHRPYGK